LILGWYEYEVTYIYHGDKATQWWINYANKNKTFLIFFYSQFIDL